MEYIYEPINPNRCKEISLVQGYCCYVKIKRNNNVGSSCLRVQKVKKDDTMESDEIIKFVKAVDIKAEIILTEWKSFFIKYYWILNLIRILFIHY